MLKQYKRLLYIFYAVLFFNLLHVPIFAQQTGNEPPKEVVLCKDDAMPVDLFNVLGIQISPDHGYWKNDNDSIVDNVFLPKGLDAKDYNFTYTITTGSGDYCAPVGYTYDVIVKLIESMQLQVHLTPFELACATPNGTIVIDSTDYGTDISYSYLLVQLSEQTDGTIKNDTIQDWKVIDHEWPYVVNDTLNEGNYLLYVRDNSPSFSPYSCYDPLWQSDTIKLGTSDPLKVELDPVYVNPTPSANGNFMAVASGGSGEYEYYWFVEKNGSYDMNDTISKTPTVTTEFGGNYLVVVVDSRGCRVEGEFDTEVENNVIQGDYFFCQGEFIEMYSGIAIEPRTIDQMLFLTAGPDIDWTGSTVEVYPSKGAAAESKDAWLTDAIVNGHTTNNGEITKYVVITKPDGKVYDQEITVKIFNRPGDLGLRLVNSKVEWEVDDIVKFETTPENMDWYVYYLNNRLLDSIENDNLYEVGAMRFTGTVQDMMKVHVLDSIEMSILDIDGLVTKDSVCTWVISEPVMINIPFPNTFTPDGDGINDIFLGGDKFGNREFHLEIVNRYGNRLYFGDKGWDGTYKGSMMPSGVYYYIVHLKLEDGTTKTLKGAVTLIRSER